MMSTAIAPRRRRRQFAPLTADQQSLAVANFRVARRIARQLTGRRPWFRDEAESSAMFGLCQAAATFDPARGVSFLTYAQPRIVGAVSDALRTYTPRGFRRQGDLAPLILSIDCIIGENEWGAPLFGNETIPDPHAEVPGAAEDAIEAVRHILRGLPRGYREPMVLLYTRADCVRLADAGRAVGLRVTRIGQIHAQSLEMLRQAIRNAPIAKVDPR